MSRGRQRIVNKATIFVLGLVCGVAMGAMLYAGAAPNKQQPSPAQIKRERAKIERLQNNIARLECELADQKDKLASLDHQAVQRSEIPSDPAEMAIVQPHTYAYFEANRGKRDGFHLSDKLVFVHRTEAGPIIHGLGVLTEIDDKSVFGVKIVEFGRSGLMNLAVLPGDEAYIINRDNSSYSLIHAALWPYPKKKEK